MQRTTSLFRVAHKKIVQRIATCRAINHYSSATTSNKHLRFYSNLIDGRAHARDIKREIQSELDGIQSERGPELKPGLAVILVGSRKDSVAYVTMKRRVANELGFFSVEANLTADVSESELIQQIEKFNKDERVHGILIQLPLPSHINEENVLSHVSLEKDVDGFHPINMGTLAMKAREPLFLPCTPKGCMELLDREGVQIDGVNAVVIGRSNIVGLPMSLCLLHRNASVTVCHTHTDQLKMMVPLADILVVACGVPHLVQKEWVKPGAVVIDVGINAIPDPSRPSGYRIVGDVDFENVKQVASKITPVPGGVGPMTIAMLMLNTFISFKRSLGISQ